MKIFKNKKTVKLLKKIIHLNSVFNTILDKVGVILSKKVKSFKKYLKTLGIR